MTNEQQRHTPTFYAWLLEQREQDSPVGEFARAAKYDRTLPRRATMLATYQKHLQRKNADRSAVEALNEAWHAWEASRQADRA